MKIQPPHISAIPVFPPGDCYNVAMHFNKFYTASLLFLFERVSSKRFQNQDKNIVFYLPIFG